jgi:Ni/Co efflux regulator RcnB
MNRSIVTALLVLTTAFGATSVATAEIGVSVVFSKDEVRIISAWYREHGHDRGSRVKAKGLPPGIAKNLARGKPLPPGIAKQHLPNGLVSLLPPPPHGYERLVIDGKVLLVEIATHVIHDILTDAVLH